MKKIILFVLLLSLIKTTGFAENENLVLENRTSYPSKNQKSKIAIQWASSAKEVDEYNRASIYGLKLNPDSLKILTESGKVALIIPEKAEYFRVLVWSKEEENPDFLTNWVDVIPNKTYTLTTEHLVPSVLMSGCGC